MVLNEYSKAIVGGLVAGLAALQTALLTSGVTSNEIIIIVFAVLTGAGLVAAVPNSGTYAWIDTTTKNEILARKAAEKRISSN